MDKGVYDWIRDVTYFGLEKIGLYYSQYRGFVMDNDDPKGYGRLRINVPDIHGDQVPAQWAWPVSTYSGKGYGAQVLPQINDVVWVRFEKGSTRKPLWAHGYFGAGGVPEELKGPTKYWFRTPSGITILVDDNTKEISLYEKDKPLEPMVLGNTLEEKLTALIDIIKVMKINTQLGPQSILPPYVEQLNTLKDELEQFKSENCKLS